MSKATISPLSVAAFLFLSQNVSADSINPTFNLTGTWLLNNANASFFQQRTEVIFVDVFPGVAHYYVGRYITSDKVLGIEHRLLRGADRCATEMLVEIKVLNRNTFSFKETALASNCDVTEGQVFTYTGTRLN